MNTTKRRRGRPPRSQGPAVQLDALLAAATHSFAINGYDATSVRQLSREIGISHSLTHHYYDTKLDLWKACIDRGFGDMFREMMPELQSAFKAGQIEAVMQDLIKSYVLLSARFSDYILILLREAGNGGERFDYIIENYFQKFTPMARDYYQKIMQSGKINSIPWETFFTFIFLGGPARYALAPLMQVLNNNGGATTDPDQHARDVADLVLRGLLPRT